MHSQPTLTTRFARNTFCLRSETPLTEAQMQQGAPSIFAPGKHASRSARYTYIPTSEVLRGLRREGFEPFMVAQGRSRIEGKTAYTKHMVRLRHAEQVRTGAEAHEVILINSHDGASAYQMLAGVFRFVCCNGLVVGDIARDVRIPHKGDVLDRVIASAFDVLEDFEAVAASTETMKGQRLAPEEQQAFATAALALRYEPTETGVSRAPIAAEQLLEVRRADDLGADLWTTFQRVQENMMRGGQHGRSVQGRRVTTRPVGSIDRSVALNRALWVLAEEMAKLR